MLNAVMDLRLDDPAMVCSAMITSKPRKQRLGLLLSA